MSGSKRFGMKKIMRNSLPINSITDNSQFFFHFIMFPEQLNNHLVIRYLLQIVVLFFTP